MNTIRFYDFDTKTVTEMPAAELAPGCIAGKVQGIEGTVYVEARKTKLATEYRHPAFTRLSRARARGVIAELGKLRGN